MFLICRNKNTKNTTKNQETGPQGLQKKKMLALEHGLRYHVPALFLLSHDVFILP